MLQPNSTNSNLVKTILFLLLTQLSNANGQTVEWIRQFGTEQNDYGYGVAEDGSGGAYAVGYSFEDEEATHPRQAFISRFDSSGTMLWSETLGEFGESDIAYQVISDPLGNAYVAAVSVPSGRLSRGRVNIVTHSSQSIPPAANKFGIDSLDENLETT